MRCFFKNEYFECENEYRIVLRIPEELLLRKECLSDIVEKGQFKRGKSNISEHIKHIFEEGELEEAAVVRKFRTTAADGKNYNTRI